MKSKNLNSYFNKDSFIPLLIFILGLFTIFEFANENYSIGFFTMIISLIIYMTNNLLLIKNKKKESNFNQYLDDLSEFVAFGVSSIVFAIMYYRFETSFIAVIIVYFFAIATLLSMARNWTLSVKNSIGWPVPFHALFLSLLYYVNIFYFGSAANSIFLLYFIVAGLLSSSNYNFLGNLDPKLREEDENETLDKFFDIEEKENNQDISIKQQIESFYDNLKKDESDWDEPVDIDLNNHYDKNFKNKNSNLQDDLDLDFEDDFELDEQFVENNSSKTSDNNLVIKKSNDMVDSNKNNNIDLENQSDKTVYPTEQELKDTLDPPRKSLNVFSKLLWKFKKKEEPLFTDKEFPSKSELKETLLDKDTIKDTSNKSDSTLNENSKNEVKTKVEKENKNQDNLDLDFEDDFELDESFDDELDRKWT